MTRFGFMAFLFFTTGCDSSEKNTASQDQIVFSEGHQQICVEQQKLVMKKYLDNPDADLDSLLDILLDDDGLQNNLAVCDANFAN